MGVLFSIIKRFFNLILFVGLEIIALLLIARQDTITGNAIMSSANSWVAFWYAKQNGVTDYFGLKKQNDSLRQENLRLWQKLSAYSETDHVKDSTAIIGVEGTDSLKTLRYARYNFYKARVVNNSVNSANNFITINRGSKDGISPNMALISANGVVGRITKVSDHFSTALSILNTKQRLSAKLSDGTTSFIYWDMSKGSDVLLMKINQPELSIKKGDSVLTTSYSTVFPANFLIGRVDRIFTVKKDNARLLYIKPATNFRNMNFVYAIKDDYLPERASLEDTNRLQQSSTR